MTEPVVEIRRYPNRRLYDRSKRRYVTLADVEELVLVGRTIEVRDSRTGEDLTRQILTQILLERHPAKIALFPVPMLHGLLRANDLAMQFWRWYLRQASTSMEGFQKFGGTFASPIDWVSALVPGLRPPPPTREAPDEVLSRVAELEDRIARLEGGGESAAGVSEGVDSIGRLERRVHSLEGRNSA